MRGALGPRARKPDPTKSSKLNVCGSRESWHLKPQYTDRGVQPDRCSSPTAPIIERFGDLSAPVRPTLAVLGRCERTTIV